jgi:hypothetical protein
MIQSKHLFDFFWRLLCWVSFDCRSFYVLCAHITAIRRHTQEAVRPACIIHSAWCRCLQRVGQQRKTVRCGQIRHGRPSVTDAFTTTPGNGLRSRSQSLCWPDLADRRLPSAARPAGTRGSLEGGLPQRATRSRPSQDCEILCTLHPLPLSERVGARLPFLCRRHWVGAAGQFHR